MFLSEQTSRGRNYYDAGVDGAEDESSGLRAGVGWSSPPRHLSDAGPVHGGVPHGCDTKQARTHEPVCKHARGRTAFHRQPTSRCVGSQRSWTTSLGQVGRSASPLPPMPKCGHSAIASTRSSRNARTDLSTRAAIPLYGLQLALLRIDRSVALDPFLVSQRSPTPLNELRRAESLGSSTKGRSENRDTS